LLSNVATIDGALSYTRNKQQDERQKGLAIDSALIATTNQIWI